MRTTINHALDILEREQLQSHPDNVAELIRVVKRVQADYSEIVENALSLLVQSRHDECQTYLTSERDKLGPAKERIANLISEEERWHDEFHRLTIEYLFTRARLVDEIRVFPNFAHELLDRLTLDQSIGETITYLEEAMTGKQDLFGHLLNTAPHS